MNNSSKLTKEQLASASEETKRLLSKPPVAYENTNKGYESACEDFQYLMDYALGTDEGKVVNNALDWKRWELQEYYKKKHGWEVG
jgi:hypothetical protein